MVMELALAGLASLTQPILTLGFIWLINAAGTFFSIWGKGDRLQDEADFNANWLKGKPLNYDFIVVGAGSAGSIVANRLSRHLHSVLLLEAGGEPMPFQYLPQGQLFLINYPETDWSHRTVTQKHACLNSINAQGSWSAGKGLGGSGLLNGMVHLRGHRRDYDRWANLTGDPSWSWKGVLPFFKSYESYPVPGDPENHGYTGELKIEQTDHLAVGPEFIQAAVELGYPNVDINGPYDGAGFDYIRYPMRHGRRVTAYNAFLEPIKYLPLLTIMKYAHVNKVLFKEEDNTAYGVQFDRHGVPMTAYASKEVILCAGSIGSPKILMLSGVGPREHLQDLNIPVMYDLPVGKNLQDHVGVYLSPFFIDAPRAVTLERDFTLSNIVKWFTLGKGSMSSSGPIATGLFTSKYAKARGEHDWPDSHIFILCYTAFPTSPKFLSHAYSLKNDEMTKYYEHAMNKDACHILVAAARPFSRGYLKLGGSSPYDKPIIDPNYMGDSSNLDFKVTMEAVKKTLYLMENTTAMGSLGTRFTSEKLPQCEHLEFRSEAYWECFIRTYTVTLHHPVGTASMGTVVDTKLRVLGTKNLRVMDASIQPVLITTNTQASAIMIGEKGVGMVIRDWSKKVSKSDTEVEGKKRYYRSHVTQKGNKKPKKPAKY